MALNAQQESVLSDIHSCEDCEKIVYNVNDLRLTNPVPSKIAIIRVKTADVRHGAARGCLLMAQMRQVMDERETKGLAMPDVDWIELEFRGFRGGGQSEADWADTGKMFLWDKEWMVRAEPENPSAKWVRSKMPCRDLGSPETLRLAGGWLKDCTSQHPGCCAASGHFRPRRLIDTTRCGADEVVKLDTDTAIVDLPYLTLSYCWGGDQKGKTLQANLISRMHGFNLRDQPKTIQDAVAVTRALGIRFVWVDSLCIVQDDEDDKVHEITRMHDIYRHSHLTISASRSSSSQEGFLNFCTPVDPIRLTYRGPDGILGSVILSSPDLRREPIHSRAWTLQEHALSARLLIFGTFGMRWVCRAGQYRDGEQENYRAVRNMLAEQLLDPQSSNPIGLWHDVVVGYSSRGLTNIEDRLPAVSAMATMNSATRKADDQYLAGLWMNSLPRDLLWNVPTTGVDWARGERVQHSGFPSWSWASIRGPIGGFTPLGREDVVTLRPISFDVELRNATAPFGQVKSGRLTLEGFMFVVRGSVDHRLPDASGRPSGLQLVSDAVVDVQCCGSHPQDETRDTTSFKVSMDHPADTASPEGHYCLEVMSDPNNPRTSTGLLLRPTGVHENTFTRVGHYWPPFPRDLTETRLWAQRLTVDIV